MISKKLKTYLLKLSSFWCFLAFSHEKTLCRVSSLLLWLMLSNGTVFFNLLFFTIPFFFGLIYFKNYHDTICLIQYNKNDVILRKREERSSKFIINCSYYSWSFLVDIFKMLYQIVYFIYIHDNKLGRFKFNWLLHLIEILEIMVLQVTDFFHDKDMIYICARTVYII